jgi:NADPH:quinone reductase-like Zn-dependent oxidoreductase
MLAAYVETPNFADPLAALIVGERPEPEIHAGWTHVTVEAASLNRHDIWTLQGVTAHPLSLPMILGCDGAGRLDDGTEVMLYPVIPAPGWYGVETHGEGWSVFSELHPGTMAECVTAPVRNVLRRPAQLSAAAAASLGTTWLTAYRMLFTQSGLQPGATVLIQGASGGVNTALIQLGSAAGITVWVTGSTPEKRALAERLGAHRTFATNEALPRRVDAVMETVGQATWAHSLEWVRRAGTIVVVGMTSGNDPSANVARLFLEQIRIIGSGMGTLEEFTRLVEFVTTNDIKPEIGMSLPLSEAREGFRAMAEGRTAGKIVFTMSRGRPHGP